MDQLAVRNKFIHNFFPFLKDPASSEGTCTLICKHLNRLVPENRFSLREEDYIEEFIFQQAYQFLEETNGIVAHKNIQQSSI